MNEDDVEQVVHIERGLFSDPWPEFVFYDDVASESSYPYVAQIDNEIVGYLVLIVDLGSGHLTNMGVAEKYQRKSIAKKLLSFILGLAVEKKLARLTLEVRLSNKPAILLYESFGFKHLKVEKDYYRNPVEDGLVMIREFDNPGG
jgi:ribosomal-protein-alanine N-acetyltransferase